MTKPEMLALVERQLEAYNRRELDAFVSCFHAEIKVLQLVSNVSRNEGIDTFRSDFKKFFESAPNLKCELKSRIVQESTVIDEEWVTGAPAYPQGLHATAIYAFRDGLIDRIWFAR